MTTTLTARFPTGLVQSGRGGYWGASARTEVLTYALIDAIAAGVDTTMIVWQLGDELASERAPTPNEMDWDEAAYERSQRDLQQRLWEESYRCLAEYAQALFDQRASAHNDPDHVVGCCDCHFPGCDVECRGWSRWMVVACDRCEGHGHLLPDHVSEATT